MRSDSELSELTSAEANNDERAGESALRPTTLREFEGQPRVSDQLGLVLEAARHRGGVPDHVLLSGPVEGEVFFLDEIHRMSRPAEEMLYLAMEDFRVDVVVGKGPGATAIPLDI